MMRSIPLLALSLLAAALVAPALSAKEELVTLPERDSVQLTIYNSEDLTLVRERRTLSFREGENRLQFSWANTLIDPTSVEFHPVGEDADRALDVSDTSYPPESREMLVWTIASQREASFSVEISYFTSGISWSAEYTGIVNEAETEMDLTAFVTVHNHSGEDYENAQVRLVVGVIHLVERVVDLAQPRRPGAPPENRMRFEELEEMAEDAASPDEGAGGGGMHRPKEIEKQGLSEYYIYSVEGTETIPTGWSKRLKSFEAASIPLTTVYRYEPSKFGYRFTKVIEFKNDEEHKLGKEPLPDGIVRLYRRSNGGLGWMGALASKYIPKGDEVQVDVGPDPEVTMTGRRLSLKKTDLVFETWGQSTWLAGWTTIEEFEVEIRNMRGRSVEVEIHRECDGDYDFASEDVFETHDFRTRKIRFSLEAGASRKLGYTVTTRNGKNVRQK